MQQDMPTLSLRGRFLWIMGHRHLGNECTRRIYLKTVVLFRQNTSSTFSSFSSSFLGTAIV